MKLLMLTLLVLSVQTMAQTEIVNHSSLTTEAKVFPFEVNGIKFDAKNNGIPYPQQYHPQGVNFERIRKIHSELLSGLKADGEITKTTNILDAKVTSVVYQITTDHEPRIFIENVYENGSIANEKIQVRILIPGEFDHRGIRLSDTRVASLQYSIVSEINKNLKNTDKYKAITMLQESNSMLGQTGRAPAFEGLIEIVDGPRQENQDQTLVNSLSSSQAASR